jgi:hypothetical protein
VSLSRTLDTARALLGIVQPNMGTRATGTLTVKSTAGTPELPAGSVGLPLIVSAAGSRQIDPKRPLRVTEATALSVAGVAVPVESILGGPAQNLPAGTEVRWDPPLIGVEPVSVLASPLAGGLAAVGLGSVKSAVHGPEGLSGGAMRELFQGLGGGALPAVVLSWQGSGAHAPKGRNGAMRPDSWRFYVAISRGDAYENRTAEGMAIVDFLEDALTQGTGIDGYVVSSLPITVIGRNVEGIEEATYVYSVSFTTEAYVENVDDRSFADWLRTKYTYLTAETPPLPVIDGIAYDMDPTTPPPPFE